MAALTSSRRRPLAVLHNGQQRRLQRALQRAKNPSTRLRIQMVVLRHKGLAQPEIAEVAGKSLSAVNRAHMAHAGGGIKALQVTPSGGRINQHMAVAAEKVLPGRFAKAAGPGGLLNIHELQAAYEQAIGHAASKRAMDNLLARPGWRTLRPRRPHPKRDLAAQKRCKKRLSRRGQARQASGRWAWPPPENYVHGPSAVGPDQPPASVRGAARSQTRSRRANGA